MDKDYYGILGVKKDATDAEIKSAYRNLAKQYHPDKFSTASESEKKSAEEKFKDINQAYSVLSDKEKRTNYDNYGSEDGPMGGGFGGGYGAGGFGGGFDDIFSNIFSAFGGGGRRGYRDNRVDGDDITMELVLTFREAAFGCEKEITINRNEECKDCKGTGAKDGTKLKTCSRCNGTGTILTVQNTPFGRIQNSQVCPECRGTGKIIEEQCPTCRGRGFTRQRRTVKITVPAGVDNGQMMTYYNEGEAGKNGGKKGNLIIILSVKAHPVFKRRGSDLLLEMPITFTQAALGAKVDIPTLNEPVSYQIPECTQTGTMFRIKGKGLKYLKKEQYGDLYVTVTVETPKGLNKEQKEQLKKLGESLAQNQSPKQKSYYDSLRNL
ncbi:MAG: molecular chaperone DnaJ [Clostridia bacterium]|nr:molecular chaperone DnaJ [Clostridia bacterium]